MIITSTKKKKPNLIDNFQRIIDSAGETQFKNIYKNLQVELKDKIITQLLSKLEKQKKLIEEYKEEILSLKNDLVYLLKRVIISKNEEKSIFSNAKKNNFKLVKKYSLSNNKLDTRPFSPMNNKMSQLKSFTHYYNQTESKCNNDNSEASNMNTANNNFIINQTDLDIKINNYINSIYRHNFAKNDTNICEYYSLNKTESLYDEIFHKKLNQKNNEIYVGTDPCLKKKKSLYNNITNSNNKSQRNISTSLTKRPIETVEDKKKNRKLVSSSMLNIKNKNNYTNVEDNEEYIEDIDINCLLKDDNNDNNDIKYLKVKKKNPELSLDPNNSNEINNYKGFNRKIQHNGLYTTQNGNKNRNSYNATGLKKKIKRNYHYIPLNRSPFLANKF